MSAKEFCVQCGDVTEFTYDGEQWMCLKCGGYDCNGGFNDSIPRAEIDEADL